MKQSLLYLLLVFLLPFCSQAQYTDMINTNRPGVSQGAFSVGTNVLQFESGISYGKEKPVALGHDESAWSVNRRVEILYPGR